ncbi:MAG: YggS family pyridoxal phosphate-dependent enzyme [Termitinemataceae bacterium]|nr:MAG: YggS family pyridoxal phosphate-dependent enzyme [Termitinemataceae bacterium]
MGIASNIEFIDSEINECCLRVGRKRSDVRLMAVSKFHPQSAAEEAFKAGLTLFGESRVKEASEKFENFANGRADIELHMIGTLQRNKAKLAVSVFDCIQSVDRNDLIIELNKVCEHLYDASGSSEVQFLKIMLELNAGEENKSGYKDIDELFFAADTALACSNIKISGLMTMAPFTDDTKAIRAAFSNLAEAQKQLQRRFSDCDWSSLSMGMSGDYKIAIEEGSTILRIGEAIFGERNI